MQDTATIISSLFSITNQDNKTRSHDLEVKIPKDVVSCQEFGDFMQKIIYADSGTGVVNLDNIDSYNYKRIYLIFSNRFSIQDCLKEMQQNSSGGRRYNSIIRFNTNSIETDADLFADLTYNQYFHKKDYREQKLANYHRISKTRTPFVISIVDTVNI